MKRVYQAVTLNTPAIPFLFLIPVSAYKFGPLSMEEDAPQRHVRKGTVKVKPLLKRFAGSHPNQAPILFVLTVL